MSRWILLALPALGFACSLAGLDDYASGTTTGSGASTGTGGQGLGGQSTGGTTSGTGTVPCSEGVPCGEVCVDPTTDAQHCGACGNACAAGYACVAGACGNEAIDVATSLTACVVLRNGEVWCWGRNVWGEAGVAPSNADPICPLLDDHCLLAPHKVPGISGAVEVGLGREAVCVRTEAGEVWCWGSNAAGLLGRDGQSVPSCTKAGGPDNGSTGPCSATPTKIALPPGVVAAQLSMGSSAGCIRSTTNDVYCWGKNNAGQVAFPTTGTGPIMLPTKNFNVNADAEDVAVSWDVDGIDSTICVRQSGTDQIRCWGAGRDGSLVPGAAWPNCAGGCDPLAHTIQNGGSPLTGQKVRVGWLVGCALSGSTLSCWGNDNYGQSGLGAQSPGAAHFDPTPVPGLPPIHTFSLGFLTTLALEADGTLWSVGWNDEGQTGKGVFGPDTCPKGDQLCANTAQKVEGLTGVTKVRVGMSNAAAITSKGKVYMWGANYTATLAHPPNTGTDQICPGSAGDACNPTPQLVTGLP